MDWFQSLYYSTKAKMTNPDGHFHRPKESTSERRKIWSFPGDWSVRLSLIWSGWPKTTLLGLKTSVLWGHGQWHCGRAEKWLGRLEFWRCSKSSFFVQKFKFEFTRKLSIFFRWKTRENVGILDFFGVDNFDFTRKIVKKKFGWKTRENLTFRIVW